MYFNMSIAIRCISCDECDGIDCKDCPNHGKSIRTSINGGCYESLEPDELEFILKLVIDYGFQIDGYIKLLICRLTTNDKSIVIDVDQTRYRTNITILYDYEIVANFNHYEYVYKYLDENEYKQKPTIQLKFVD